MKSVIRTKTYHCGKQTGTRKAKYLEIDLFPWLDNERPRMRARKEKESLPKQKKLNDKNAARKFALLVKSNFGDGDLHISCTYDPKHLPESVEAAEREVKNFLRRVSRARQKQGLPVLKYIYITECGSKTGRIHHHIFMNAGLARDEIEYLWGKNVWQKQEDGKSVRVHERTGDINADRLREDDNGLARITCYLSKDPKGRKRWVPSRNLDKPEVYTSDTKTSKKKFYTLTALPVDCQEAKEFFERKYPGYVLTELEKYWNEVSSTWSLRAKMSYKQVTGKLRT